MSGYLEVSLICPLDAEEQVTTFITQSLAQGLITDDEDDILQIRFYLTQDESSREKIEVFNRYLVNEGIITVEQLEAAVSVKSVEEIDWIKTYQESFQSIRVKNVIVKSIWDKNHYPDKIEIVLEPKMAFGTGHHETTQLCIAQLLDDVKEGDKLLDLGCGSGILSILAVKLGASECFGLDIDIAAIENANENIRHNKVEDKIEIVFGSMEKVKQIGNYDIVASNLIKDEIINLFENFMRALKPNGILILSGILDEQEEEFVDFLKLKNISEPLITHQNEWICCRVSKKA